MHRFWKGLLIAGLFSTIIGWRLMSQRQKSQSTRKFRRNLVKVAKVGTPITKAVRTGRRLLPRMGR